MMNEIDIMLNFTDEKYQKEFDEKVRKEQIMTMSDHFSQTSKDLGTIRYFFGGYRDGVDERVDCLALAEKQHKVAQREVSFQVRKCVDSYQH